jgi:hypothetical protein
LVAACSGSSVNTTPVAPAPVATPTAPALAALTTFTPVTTSAVASTTATTTLPTLTPPTGVDAGTSATIAVPALSVAGSASASMAAGLPSGAPALSSLTRASAQSLRSAQSENAPVLGLLFFGFSVSTPTAATVTLNYPTFTIGLPSSYFVAGTSYYMALYDPTHPSAGWQSRAEACTAGVTAPILTCTGSGSLTVANNITYYFGLYAVSAAAASPTPAPTGSAVAVATNSPTPIPSASASPSASPTATASPTASPSPSASPSPTASPTASPIALSTTIASSGVQINLPNINGVAGLVSIGSAGGGAVLSGTVQTNPGNGYAPTTTAGNITTFYSALFSNTATGTGNLFNVSVAMTLPAAQASGGFYLATFDGTNWNYTNQGPIGASVTGGTGTVIFTITPTITVAPGVNYGVALYSVHQ